MNSAIPESIVQAHELYQQMTGQRLSMGFDRQRMWFEWWRSGFTLADLRRVIAYLQREIRESRRNVGALKLSNLLQPDRFEEDLNISRVALYAPQPKGSSRPSSDASSVEEQERIRQRGLQWLRDFKKTMHWT
jgi:hypothetical protein